jgi:hypothetical protein
MVVEAFGRRRHGLVQPAKNRMVIHTGASDICAELIAYSPGDKNPINRHHLPVFGEQRSFIYEPLGLERVQIERKTHADNPIDRRKVNVVIIDHYNQLPCVTLSVNGLRPLAALELMRMAANGWVYVNATEVALVAAVKFGSLIQTTLAAGVCITSSRQYCRVAGVEAEAPSTRTATGAPLAQSQFTGRDCPTLDSVTVTVLAKPMVASHVQRQSLSRSAASLRA